MPRRWTLVLLVTLLVAVGCGGADPPETYRRAPLGTVVAESRFDYDTTVHRLDSALQATDAVRVVARIDHAAQAEQANTPLRPTHVVLFGNPQLGTPLMQRNPLAALDLPQKLLVYETPDGRAMLVYNSVDYLAQRYGLGGVETLPAMTRALRRLAEQVAAGAATPLDSLALEEGAGIIQVGSAASVDETFRRLRAQVEAHELLSIAATVDHAATAERVGRTLPPIKLLALDHPAMSAPLVDDAPTLALDLPFVILVYRAEDGAARIAYSDPFFLAKRHVLPDHPKRLRVIADGLARLAAHAAGDG